MVVTIMDMIGFQNNIEYDMYSGRDDIDSTPRGSIPTRSNNLQRALQRYSSDASGRATTDIHPS